jgi:hypothetical protein
VIRETIKLGLGYASRWEERCWIYQQTLHPFMVLGILEQAALRVKDPGEFNGKALQLEVVAHVLEKYVDGRPKKATG